MKRLLLLLTCAAFALTGCDSVPSMSTRVRERFTPVPPQTKEFDGDVRTVYFAAQQAFKRLDFNLSRSSLGHVEASSRINTSAAFRDSRQLVATVDLRETAPGKVEAAMILVEQVEGEGIGGPSQQPLRQHGFYETYFAMLQEVLAETASADAAKKN
jgi:hypothetical protein